MPFERPSIVTIKDRIEKGIEARLFSNLALLRNAVLRILARVFAGEIHGNYGYLEWISRQLFVVTAETEFLNRHGRMWGVARIAGSFSVGDAEFSGVESTLIPTGTIFQTSTGIEFVSVEDATISGGLALIHIQSTEPGASFNLPNTTPLQLVSPIEGVSDDGQIISSTTGGVDEENDEDYRQRILQRIQNTPAGGSAADYVRWAREVTGVALAWCYPLYNGPGTVVTVIRAQDPTPVADSTLLTEVTNYIEERKPVTATQTVSTVTTAEVTIVLQLAPNISEIQERIKTNIDKLFRTHKPGSRIIWTQLMNAISQAGVSEFTLYNISVDSVSRPLYQDIILTGFQYPVRGFISFVSL